MWCFAGSTQCCTSVQTRASKGCGTLGLAVRPYTLQAVSRLMHSFHYSKEIVGKRRGKKGERDILGKE